MSWTAAGISSPASPTVGVQRMALASKKMLASTPRYDDEQRDSGCGLTAVSSEVTAHLEDQISLKHPEATESERRTLLPETIIPGRNAFI